MQISGTSQILFVAPNNSSHKVANLTGKISAPQPNTGDLVRTISENSDANGYIVTEELQIDPNWHGAELNPVKEVLSNISSSKNTKYFIEFHELEEDAPYDIRIYYPRGFHKSGRFAREVKDNLVSGRHLKDVNLHIYNFPLSKGESLSLFSARELKNASIRIDLAGYIFSDKILREELELNIYTLIGEI